MARLTNNSCTYTIEFRKISPKIWKIEFSEEDNEPRDEASHLLIWQLLTDIPGNPMG